MKRPRRIGGEVSAYRIERRKRPAGFWETVGTGPLSEITLVEQTRNVEWEYRIIAFNKAGDSEPSNTVLAVL